MGIVEQIEAIKAEYARTQKNKHTEYHTGRLKARLAQLEAQLLAEASKTGPKGTGFEVEKLGQARAALVGFPSTGKSSLLNVLTNSKSEVAAYEFTTLTCIPGQMFYNNAQIQILDLPGIITGASDNRGRGKEVIATSRTADLIIMMLDALRAEEEREKLESELCDMGVRINESRPNVEVIKAKGGGIKVNFTVEETHGMDYQAAQAILQEFKIFNCVVTVKEDITEDRFVDALSTSRVYLPCIYCVNKIDMVSIEAVNWFMENGYIPISVSENLNINFLKQVIWQNLRICRVYTKKRGEHPDLSEAIFMKEKDTIKDVCGCIHKDLFEGFQYALVWGRSVEFPGERVGENHEVQDGDVIEVVCK